jgi:hypothetical protein
MPSTTARIRSTTNPTEAVEPTNTWTNHELSTIGDAEKLQPASKRADGTLHSYATMWVVRVGGDLYVRSADGPTNPWFRRAKARGAGRVRAGGIERDVTFAEPVSEVQTDVDAAYHNIRSLRLRDRWCHRRPDAMQSPSGWYPTTINATRSTSRSGTRSPIPASAAIGPIALASELPLECRQGP